MTHKFKVLRNLNDPEFCHSTVTADGAYSRAVSLAGVSRGARYPSHFDVFPVSMPDDQILSAMEQVEDFDAADWEIVTCDVAIGAT